MDSRSRVPSQIAPPPPPQRHPADQKSSSVLYHSQHLPHQRYVGDGFGPETPRHDRPFSRIQGGGENLGFAHGAGASWSNPSMGRTGRDRDHNGGREDFFGTPLPDRVNRTFDQLSRQYREGTASRAGSVMPRSYQFQPAWRYDSLGPSPYHHRAASVQIGAGPSESAAAPWSPARPPRPLISESTLSWLKDPEEYQHADTPALLSEPSVTRERREADSVEARGVLELRAPVVRHASPVGQSNHMSVANEVDFAALVTFSMDEDVGIRNPCDVEEPGGSRGHQEMAEDIEVSLPGALLSAPAPSTPAEEPRNIDTRTSFEHPAPEVPLTSSSSQIEAPPASAPMGPAPLRLENWNLTMVHCKEPPGKVVRSRKEASSLLRWVYVQGIKTEAETPIPWRTSTIANRLGPNLVQTASGSTYQLVGPLDRQQTRGNGFSEETAAAFEEGFPAEWIDVLFRDLGELNARHAIAQFSSTQQSSPPMLSRSQPLRKGPVSTPKAKKVKTTRPSRSAQADAALEEPAIQNHLPAEDDDMMMSILMDDSLEDDVAPDELTILATPKTTAPAATGRRTEPQKRSKPSVNGGGTLAKRDATKPTKKTRIADVDEVRQISHDSIGTSTGENMTSADREKKVEGAKQSDNTWRSKKQRRHSTSTKGPTSAQSLCTATSSPLFSTNGKKQRQVSRELASLGRSPWGMMKVVKYALVAASLDAQAAASLDSAAVKATAVRTPSPGRQRLSWGKGPEDDGDVPSRDFIDSPRGSGRRASARARRAPDPKWWIVSPGFIKVEVEEEELGESLNGSALQSKGTTARSGKVAVEEGSVDGDDDEADTDSPSRRNTRNKKRKKQRVIEDTPDEDQNELESVKLQAKGVTEKTLAVADAILSSTGKTMMTPSNDAGGAAGSDGMTEDELAIAESSAAPVPAGSHSTNTNVTSGREPGAIDAKGQQHERPESEGEASLLALAPAPPSQSQPIVAAGRRVANEKGARATEVDVNVDADMTGEVAAAADYIGKEKVAIESDDDEEWERQV